MTIASKAPAAAAKPAPAPFRLPLIAALALAFVSLALISGIAYIVVLAGATGTAERLLVDRAARVVDAQVSLIRGRLDPITEQLELIAALAAAGRIDVDSPIAVREALAVMMTREPEVSAAAFATLGLQLHRAAPSRRLDRARHRLAAPACRRRWSASATADLAQYLLGRAVLERRAEAAVAQRAHAGAAHRRRLHRRAGRHRRGRRPLLPHRRPGQVGGRYFILVNHDRVLAHRRLIDARGLGLSEDKPLPGIHDVDDPVLAKFWDPPVRSPAVDRALGSLGHVVEASGRRWVFVYRQITGYGPEPWLVGQYFPIEDATADLDRLVNGAIVGAATLAVALLLALLMGLRMARSIRTISTAAEAIERLEFDQPMHRRSRLREIDERRIASARGALRWFGAYVRSAWYAG